VAALGTGQIVSPPAPVLATSNMSLWPGIVLAPAAVIVPIPGEGGGGEPFEPRQFMNVGGVAVPIG
jgi:hypothetical protein